jgi:hypothetical protein
VKSNCRFIGNATEDHDRRMANARRLMMSKRIGASAHASNACIFEVT